MKRILPVLHRLGIPDAGAASFSSCLPLLDCRAVERLPLHPASVIVCIFPYLTLEDGPRNLSRYAVVPDYHRVAGEMLQTACEQLSAALGGTFVSFVDNSPIREVNAALRAGLGVLGRHSLLIHPAYGSWVFLGSIVTDLVVEWPEHPITSCLDCGRCISACPSGCIGKTGPDPARCVSAITQKRGELTPEEKELVQKGGLLWGCDICQQVCPMNQKAALTPLDRFVREKSFLTAGDLTRAVRFHAYGFRGPGPLRRNFRLLYGEGKTESLGLDQMK